MFNNCGSLENITFTGSINKNIDFNYSTKLTYESVKSILTACSNTTNTNSKTVTFKRTLTDQNGELLALVESCTSKGWTISGLTLN
jgi:type IV secretory pathway component VirB8